MRRPAGGVRVPATPAAFALVSEGPPVSGLASAARCEPSFGTSSEALRQPSYAAAGCASMAETSGMTTGVIDTRPVPSYPAR